MPSVGDPDAQTSCPAGILFSLCSEAVASLYPTQAAARGLLSPQRHCVWGKEQLERLARLPSLPRAVHDPPPAHARALNCKVSDAGNGGSAVLDFLELFPGATSVFSQPLGSSRSITAMKNLDAALKRESGEK